MWTTKDGAPGGITALAQTRDGFLWLGGATGLFRFDGVRFERYEPPDGQFLPATAIAALWAAPDGLLWVGFNAGGVSKIAPRGAGLVSYGLREGLPMAVVSSFALDSAGTVWASTARGLAYLQASRWHFVDTTRGYPGGYTNQIMVDRRGGLWVDAPVGVYTLPRGSARFTRRAPPLDVGTSSFGAGSVLEAPGGDIWLVSATNGLIRLADSTGQDVSAAPSYDRDVGRLRGWASMVIDRKGNAWGLYTPGRLVRVALADGERKSERAPPAWDTLTLSPKAGSSGSVPTAVLDDREGNVWVATEGGLEQFREPKFRASTLPNSFEDPRLAAAEGGKVWVGGAFNQLKQIDGNGSTSGSIPIRITHVSRDLVGDNWMGGLTGIWHHRAGRFEAISLPRELRDCIIYAIARARDGTLWVSGQRRGVFLRRGGVWQRFGGSDVHAMSITADSDGRTWIGYMDGRLVRVDSGNVRTREYGSADGLNVGGVLAVTVSGGRVWIGGDRGMAILDVSAEDASNVRATVRFSPLGITSGPLRSVSGVVLTDDAVWLRDADGVARIPHTEVARSLRERGRVMRAERFDSRDRVDGPAWFVGPNAIVGTDKRVWVPWIGGLGWIDPAHIQRNTIPPPIMVRALSAAGRTYANSDRVTLPKRTAAISVAYTALSLAVPERVQFRYRLVGLDTTWQDAGPRREAFYTNLRPGAYRFEVTAANDDGVWSVAPATLDVLIPPAFVQTNAFLALCVVAAGGSLWLLAVSRQRRAVASERARQQVMLDERLRVARELHDTLLTDVAGLRMQLDAATRAAGPAGVATDIVARLRDQASDALVSARKAVVDMRATSEGPALLSERLAAVARRIFADTSVDVRITHTGTPRRYASEVESESLRIAGEALANARAHARCNALIVTCAYDPRELRIEVRDDGRGFDLSQAAADGHFGLVGMRERASAIGAQLSVNSVPAQGTVILLVVPIAKTD
ncbi:MAG: hypothetical protein H7099_05310 [Gemmatimonadaceae bacterium]|nr:hypothetical protein [Gemmatimonadaceae bacterium]